MPVVEICKWTVSDAFASDPSVIQPALDYLVKVDGCLGVYHGLAEEDNKIHYLILIWETYEHHEALMKLPGYPQVIGLEPSVGAGGIQMNHVEFLQEFIPLFNAPTTDILSFKLKEGKSQEHVYLVLEELLPKVAALNNNKYPPGAWGQTREEKDKFYLTTGWDSMKDHMSVVIGPSLTPLIEDFAGSVTCESHNVNLAKHV